MATDTDTPTAPKKTENPTPEGSTGGASTPTLPQDKNPTQKANLPIAPIFTNQGHSNKAELEREKSAQQNYLINLNQTLAKRKASIKRAQKYLVNLEAAYNRAQSSGTTDTARRLTESISQTKATLGLQEKQKTLIEHYILDANKVLSEIHGRLAHAQNTHNPTTSKPNKKVSTGSVTVKAPQGTTVGVTSTAAGAQYAKAITANQAKSKIKVKESGKTVTGTGTAATISVPSGQPSKTEVQISQGADTSTSRYKAKKLLGLGLASSVAGLFSKKQKSQSSVVFDQTSQTTTDTSKGATINTFRASPSTQPATAQTTNSLSEAGGVTRWVVSSAASVTGKVIEVTGKTLQLAGRGLQVAGTAISASLGSIPYIGIPFKALGIGINGAGKGIQAAGKGLESFGKGLGKLKQGLKMIKSARILAASVGPIGLALLLNKRMAQIRKVIAAAIAGLLYLLYLLWIKMLGMLAGLAIGLVTGAPLLLIPGAGPFLYVGYNAYWVWRGWNDPVGTIQLATHPWELVTRPLNWVRDQIGNLGSATKGGIEGAAGGIGNAASGFLGATGNFVTGLASSAWGGITSAAGGFVSAASSFAGNFFGMLASAGSSVAGNVIPVAVGGSVASVAGATIVGTIITNSAFYTPGLDPTEQFFPPGQNELFTITKTADKSSIPQITDTFAKIPVTYTVNVTAADTTLINLKISDVITNTIGETPNIVTNTCRQESITPGAIIPAGGIWSCALTIEILIIHNNSTITNTATFTATSEDGSITLDSTAIATVIVGSVPSDCPKNWPTTGPITQGPEGGYSHADGALSPEGYEAIDIGKPDGVYGDPVKSTISGKVVNIWSKPDNPDNDKRIEIQPFNCPGLSFVAFWHNSSLNGLKVNDTVSYGDLIAGSGAYKNSDGSQAEHLHYQFNASGDRSFPIKEPYVPDDSYGRTCSNTSGCGVTATIL